jgi:hypothetical protein
LNDIDIIDRISPHEKKKNKEFWNVPISFSDRQVSINPYFKAGVDKFSRHYEDSKLENKIAYTCSCQLSIDKDFIVKETDNFLITFRTIRRGNLFFKKHYNFLENVPETLMNEARDLIKRLFDLEFCGHNLYNASTFHAHLHLHLGESPYSNCENSYQGVLKRQSPRIGTEQYMQLEGMYSGVLQSHFLFTEKQKIIREFSSYLFNRGLKRRKLNSWDRYETESDLLISLQLLFKNMSDRTTINHFEDSPAELTKKLIKHSFMVSHFEFFSPPFVKITTTDGWADFSASIEFTKLAGISNRWKRLLNTQRSENNNLIYDSSNRFGEVIEDQSILPSEKEYIIGIFESEYQSKSDTLSAVASIKSSENNVDLQLEFLKRISHIQFEDVPGDGLCGFHSLLRIIIRNFSKSDLYKEENFNEILKRALRIVSQKQDWFYESTLVIVASFLEINLVIVNERHDIIFGYLDRRNEVIKFINRSHFMTATSSLTLW